MSYKIQGRLLEARSCNAPCPCWIGDDPDLGHCDALVAYGYDQGHINGVDVAGLTLALVTHIPGNVLDGNWQVSVHVDSKATPQQKEAILLERELGIPPLPETRAAYEFARDGRYLTRQEKPLQPAWTTLPSLDVPLIGREQAFETIKRAYDRCRRGGVIFIAGEPGVGKSRLMQEFASTCSALVLSGNSHVEEATIPYQPLIQALRQALPLYSRWTHALPIWLAELSRLISFRVARTSV